MHTCQHIIRFYIFALLLLTYQAQSVEPQPPAPVPQAEALRAILPATSPAPKLRMVLLAADKDHGTNEHDYPLWQARWAAWLNSEPAATNTPLNLYGTPVYPSPTARPSAPVEVSRAWGWPSAEQFAQAEVIVAFCYLPWTPEHKAELQRYLERGGGLVLIHSATWTMPQADPEVGALVGVGGFTQYRHGELTAQITASNHPICRGLPSKIHWVDEVYWPPTPPPATNNLQYLAVTQEEDPTSKARTAQPLFWIYETGRGRVFGCVPGHYVWTFDDPWFRLLLLRGIAWAGGSPVNRWDAVALQGARVAGE